MLILPKRPTRHNHQTSKRGGGTILCKKKCSWRLHVHSVSTGVLAFCTKDSRALTEPLFRLRDVRSRQQQAGAAASYQPAAVQPVTTSRAAAIGTWERSARRWRGRASGSWGRSGLLGSWLRAPGGRRCRCCAEKKGGETCEEKRKENSLSSVEQGNIDMI